MKYIGESQLAKDLVTKDYVDNKVANLAGYVRLAEIQSRLDNIGKLKDTKTGQFLDVMVVDKGQAPRDTTGLIVFERA